MKYNICCVVRNKNEESLCRYVKLKIYKLLYEE
jgi:hypothetical protein